MMYHIYYFQSINPFIIIERCTQENCIHEKKTPQKRSAKKQDENEQKKIK